MRHAYRVCFLIRLDSCYSGKVPALSIHMLLIYQLFIALAYCIILFNTEKHCFIMIILYS